jgi:hypothetical protein
MKKDKNIKTDTIQNLVDKGKLDKGYHLSDHNIVGGIISKPDSTSK